MAKRKPPTRTSRPKSAGRKGSAKTARSLSAKGARKGARAGTPASGAAKRKRLIAGSKKRSTNRKTAVSGSATRKKTTKKTTKTKMTGLSAARSTVKAATPRSRGRKVSSAARVGRGAGTRATLPLAPRRTTQQRGNLESLEEPLARTPPSSLDIDRRRASAARTGRAGLRKHLQEHTETGPAITGGDVDASWETAFSTGDETPGGDNPTPDQDIVDDMGRALGVEYQDNEELKGAPKIEERDRHRWELDPASSEDYPDRARKRGTKDEE